jgi:hypothetical protein
MQELRDGEVLQVQACSRHILYGVRIQLSISICVIRIDLVWMERAKRIVSSGVVLIL